MVIICIDWYLTSMYMINVALRRYSNKKEDKGKQSLFFFFMLHWGTGFI